MTDNNKMLALIVIIGGVALIYAGVKNVSVPNAAKSILKGKSPSSSSSTSTDNSAGGGGGNIPRAVVPTNLNSTTQGSDPITA